MNDTTNPQTPKPESDTRVYVVLGRSNPLALVRARTPAAAIRHVVRERYSARVASQDDLIELLPELGVEVANKEDAA